MNKVLKLEDFKANTKEWFLEQLVNMSESQALQTISDLYDELHKPTYPKTYEECHKILGLNDEIQAVNMWYKMGLILDFYELIICRNAYWKIAGDWEEKRKEKAMHYVICSTLLGEVVKDTMPNCIANYLLDFPTEEMRDEFYANFKSLIEQCKELL